MLPLGCNVWIKDCYCTFCLPAAAAIVRCCCCVTVTDASASVFIPLFYSRHTCAAGPFALVLLELNNYSHFSASSTAAAAAEEGSARDAAAAAAAAFSNSENCATYKESCSSYVLENNP